MPEGRIVLRMFHDEDVQVFLNGVEIAREKGYLTDYVDFPIPRTDLLKTGRNVLAICCRQTEGGQYIDAGIVVERAK